jgi:SAM-dependent methyltransferase
MEDLETRVKREAVIYDRNELRRERFEAAMRFANEGIGRIRRNEVIRDTLRDADGREVLEIGSQAWEWCLYRYGYRPARTVCINISEAELDVGRRHAQDLGAAIDFRQMDAHKLEFPDATFDFVFGVAILHHLEMERAVREIHRVLKPGGTMIFVEPLRNNPAARIVRWLTPHARTPDELPLGRPELDLVSRYFEVDNLYSELFLVLGALASSWLYSNPINPVTKFSDRIDRAIVGAMPFLGPYYRTVVLRGRKRAS